MKLLITNGGPHPADKWADVTTDEILDMIEVADDSDTPEAAAARQAKRDLRPQLFALLNEHHGSVQNQHRGNLAKAKRSTVNDRLDVTPHMGVADAVLGLLITVSPFKEHFMQPHVVAKVRQIISQHTADVIHIERRYHADRLPKGAR